MKLISDKMTSKGQITIPKELREKFNVTEGDQFKFSIFDEYVKIEPVRNNSESYKKEFVYYEDIKQIIKKVISEGYSGDEFVEEIICRVKSYNEFIDYQIKKFEQDLRNDSESDPEDNFNGLDVFFNSPAGENAKKT